MTAPLVVPGSADPATTPATLRAIPHRGGPLNPSAERIKTRFPDAFVRAEVIWGETNVYLRPDAVRDVVQYLHDDDAERYDYLSDVTAVEYRDLELPLQVVWHLRSLPYRRFLRIKAELPKGTPLKVPSVMPIYSGADWLERECYDMFGIVFEGHSDLRRILMWEQYAEGYPLRKDFPLRGRFSRSEQLRQALAAQPESRYSMTELTIADAFEDLPLEMRQRLAGGEKTGE
ncbi:MAG TPA: NADH-quinone oxidoreductase subunit C [Gemmatimonadaceae bacterium]|nr:NADH-quinone oxidoreductase subunit C [Gemmatimonadaceae bacterium]